MKAPDHVLSHLGDLGFDQGGEVHYALSPAALYEHALRRGEGILAAHGPLCVTTDPNTGRSPKDRFIVKTDENAETIAWGDQNTATDAATFDRLHERLAEHVRGRDLYVQDLYAGADEEYRMPVRVVTEKAWHSLFAHNMFIRRQAEALSGFEPGFTVVDLCEYEADPERDGTRSGVFVLVSFQKRLVLIGGTHYAGEIKKSIFSVLNYMLPERGVLPMHCSANQGPEGDTAVFFGLSGTGKTTLSADQRRTLIGDDEHAWSDRGVFNFEGGCYAKMIDLSPEGEPEIFSTTERFGTILENVIVHPETRVPDFSDDAITQNTRGSYPLHYIPNASPTGAGGHAETVVMLTYDAFGVLPPIARLTPEQAMFYFLSGYTAKVAGTEKGVTEPKATFSTCFGAPFMVRQPSVYAELLGEKIRRHDARCWLINTGITGGPYGTGHRIDLKHTRAMVDAALGGRLSDVETETDPVFGLAFPKDVPGVPPEVLNPKQTWDDKEAYDERARYLAEKFIDNFEQYAGHVDEAVTKAGPTATPQSA